MTTWNHKFMIAAPGGPAIEIYRATHTFQWKVWRFWMNGMDRTWEKWVECRCPDKWLTGGRIVLCRQSAPERNENGKRVRLKVTDQP